MLPSIVEARVAAACFANLSSSFLGLLARFFPAYDEGMKQIPCVCGCVVRGDDDEELWQNAQEHIREDHPELVGKVSRRDLLAQAEEVPRPSS
jgi:predicted small metal-binding protein